MQVLAKTLPASVRPGAVRDKIQAMKKAWMEKAVLLAAGLGTRMRRGAEKLPQEQAAVAATGVKALVPVGDAEGPGRPFLDYSLHALAEVGVRRVCLVVGPGHDALRSYYTELQTRRLEISFATQAEPRGTADAVLAAETFAGEDPFLVLNSDNYYPPEALRLLVGLDGPGLVGFDRRIAERGETNIPAERLALWALVEATDDGFLERIVERPDAATYAKLPDPVAVSVNCWRFSATIFAACRAIALSPRGELELPSAVAYSIQEMGERFRVVISEAPVLDLTGPADVPSVTARLCDVTVSL
jgi:dTDP-glucose pyrophosphorylase